MEELLNHRQSDPKPFLTALVESGLISQEKLFREIAKETKFPFTLVNSADIKEDFLRILPEKVARKQQAVIFKRDKDVIELATTNPTESELSEMISRKTGLTVKTYLTTPENIKKILPFYRDTLQKTIDSLLKDVPTLETSPIGKIVDLLIEYAYQDKASDIHIEPEEIKSLIRFRIDGILQDNANLPKDLHEQIISRIKVLAKLRTDEHQSPQDGKFRHPLEEENLDIRVSVIPVVDGEKMVLRLLSSKSREYELSNLSLDEGDYKKISQTLDKSYGMILCTGPTGSGKTTTIYSLIKLLNLRERNITTIEDPVEYRIAGVNQIQVNLKTNLTFANGLGSILRQDPDVIFVGEIRDRATAGIAVNAALTGHLVLSTLHTSDSVGALPRLMEMGVEQLLLASTTNIIIAQRLLRKICDQCKFSYLKSRKELINNMPADSVKKVFGRADKIKLFSGKGCVSCHQSGYLGRAGIFEVLPITKNMRKLISKGADPDEIMDMALKEGMNTMFEDGLKKARVGITTIEEVLRVTKVES